MDFNEKQVMFRELLINELLEFAHKLFNEEGVKELYNLIGSTEMTKGCSVKCPLDGHEKAKAIDDMIKKANELFEGEKRDIFRKLLKKQGVEVKVCPICQNIVFDGFSLPDEKDVECCSYKCFSKRISVEEFYERYEEIESSSPWPEFRPKAKLVWDGEEL